MQRKKGKQIVLVYTYSNESPPIRPKNDGGGQHCKEKTKKKQKNQKKKERQKKTEEGEEEKTAKEGWEEKPPHQEAPVDSDLE
mmetsp:Transcript_2268/g.4782  ORF Transcript_2268/g.4782 Transcript_2268/m.4782 type:complete len:83 (+) Transcript_2268:2598-2846(+)